MKVEYDIEKEMKKIQKKSDKVLKNYLNIYGLENILSDTLVQIDSKPFDILAKNFENYVNEYNEKYPVGEFEIGSLRDKFPILKYSLILEENLKVKLLYAFNLTDVIIYEHFSSIMVFFIAILAIKDHSDDKFSDEKIFGLTNKVMMLLDDFDQDSSLSSVDEDFFKGLKGVKWDKKASKLFEKILSVQFDILSLTITEVFSNIRKISGNYRFTLTMLAACSAVNRGSDRMEYEDVICAFRTFYKLLDADIDDLIR